MLQLGWQPVRRYVAQVFTIIATVDLTIVAMRLYGPRQAHAQASQPGSITASSLTLVGPDGTTLATLAPGAQGNGHLTLYNAAGLRTVSVEGGNVMGAAGMAVCDAAGNPRVQVCYSIDNAFASLRILGADGQPRSSMSVGTPPGGAEVSNTVVYDPDGNPRVGIGTRREDGSYALTIRDGIVGLSSTRFLRFLRQQGRHQLLMTASAQ